MFAGLPLSSLYLWKAAAVFGVIVTIALTFVGSYHPFDRFGAANRVTMARAAIVALVAGLIGEPGGVMNPTLAAIASGVVTALDGVDGWIARRTRMASAFGARFDMEIDALLVLALSILAWQYDKAGAWIILAGLFRYLFMAAGWLWPFMRRPLPPSRRRQAICVLQIIGTSLVILPVVTVRTSTWIAGLLLLTLSASFLIDVVWLWRRRRSKVRRKSDAAISSRGNEPGTNSSWTSEWITLPAALVVLDASLTFHNIWPTPAVGWSGELSIELAIALVIFVIINRLIGLPSRGMRRAVAAAWLALVLGHYIDVTAPALWGRTINFYWDFQFLPDVAAMLARAAPAWLVAATVVAAAALIVLAYVVVARALDRVWSATLQPRQRRGLMFLASLLVVLFSLRQMAGGSTTLVFSTPVTATFAQQLKFVATALSGSQALPPSPPFDGNLARVQGADVLLFFLESYGAIVYDRPEFASLLAADRAAFETSIHDSGHDVVSAFVESPTFGGSSWFAHLTLLSGIEVRNPDTNALLMTEHRDTLPTAFARHGYRTIAVMPGLRYAWPEGAFYGFMDIYSGERLNYHGPWFGWWSLTDQFTLAALDDREMRKMPRAPLFVFFPTISTHTPFTPAPPYQPDWRRMLTDRPYDDEELDRAYSDEPDWLNLSPSYVTAVSYAYRTFGGYLREHAGQDFVMILIGDHQPPAVVTGERTPWDVPVHIITNRKDVLDALISRGFRKGLTPQRPSLGKMHTLTPVLLDAFSAGKPD